MTCKERIIDLLTPNLQAVPSSEHDGADYFVHITVGDSPPIISIRMDNTPDMVAFLQSAESKEIDFEWTGEYDVVNNGNPQQDVTEESDLSIVAYLQDWAYWNASHVKITATFRLETL